MKILKYNESLWEEIIRFNKKSFPHRIGVEESFQDRFFNNPYNAEFSASYFLQDEDGNILGQFLDMSTKFHYLGKSYVGVWGIDFIIDESLRGQKRGGLLARPAIEELNYCAIGPSVASKVLHLKYGNKEVANALRFIKPLGLQSVINFILFNKKFKREEVIYPNSVQIQDTRCKRIFSTENLIEKPFWNAQNLEWDRSHAFLNWRFFQYKNKYAFYIEENQSFYFVVRKIKWKNINCLLLVDYRYHDQKNFTTIYKSVLKIASQLKVVAVISLSSVDDEKAILKKFGNKSFGLPFPVMTTNTEVASAKNVMVNPADSDFDTFYGDNVW